METKTKRKYTKRKEVVKPLNPPPVVQENISRPATYEAEESRTYTYAEVKGYLDELEHYREQEKSTRLLRNMFKWMLITFVAVCVYVLFVAGF